MEFIDTQIDALTRCESPAERRLCTALGPILFALGRLSFQAQYEAPPYRLDFAIPVLSIAVEVDGADYHSTPAQKAKDARRDAFLRREGWTVIRFTGSQVYQDAERCARIVAEAAQKVLEKWSAG